MKSLILNKKLSYLGLATLIISQSMPVTAHTPIHFNHQHTQAIPSVVDISGGVSILELNQERLIGEKVYRQIHRQMPLLENIWLEDQMMSIFSHILSQSQLGEPIALLLVNDPQINAFAVPGGLFAINTGLIHSAKNMGDIAGVMAHEVAHVSQRHYSRSKEAFKGQRLLALAGILVGAAVASQDAEAGTAVMMGTQSMLLDKQLSYSREQEREADRIGMQYLYSAGYDPHHMANFFETMQRKSPQIGYLPEFWLTHPLTSERISEARLRANQFPQLRHKIQYQDEQFQLIQYYTAVLTKKISEIQLKELSNQNNQSARLALMAYYLQKNEWQKADDIRKNIPKQYQQHPLYHLLTADLLIAQKQYIQAERLMRTQWLIMPENRALAYKLAQILILQQRGMEAQQIVQPFSKKNPRDIYAWQLLQQAIESHSQLEQSIRAVQALRYRAEQEFWAGKEEQGIKSLLHAQRLLENTDNQSLKTQIEQRLKQMQDEYKLRI